MKNGLCATLVLMLLATACATSRLRSGFDDVPLPRGLTYQPQRSVVIESPSVKAAKLVYRGRLEPESLGLAMRTLLESNGWRHVSTTTVARDGTRQVYDKGGNALEVHIYEGLWFTYLTIGVSERLFGAARASAAAVPNRERGTSPSPTTANVDTSVSAPSTPETPPASDQPRSSPDPSFAQRVRNFFTNLFPR